MFNLERDFAPQPEVIFVGGSGLKYDDSRWVYIPNLEDKEFWDFLAILRDGLTSENVEFNAYSSRHIISFIDMRSIENTPVMIIKLDKKQLRDAGYKILPFGTVKQYQIHGQRTAGRPLKIVVARMLPREYAEKIQ